MRERIFFVMWIWIRIIIWIRVAKKKNKNKGGKRRRKINRVYTYIYYLMILTKRGKTVTRAPDPDPLFPDAEPVPDRYFFSSIYFENLHSLRTPGGGVGGCSFMTATLRSEELNYKYPK